MNEFISLVYDNLGYVVGIPAVAASLTLVARWGVNRLTNMLVPWLERIVRTMMQQFFGVDASKTAIEELPIVGDVRSLVAMNTKVAEMELLRLKKECVNPLYMPEEQLVFKALYAKMYSMYKDHISEEAKAALDIYNG